MSEDATNSPTSTKSTTFPTNYPTNYPTYISEFPTSSPSPLPTSSPSFDPTASPSSGQEETDSPSQSPTPLPSTEGHTVSPSSSPSSGFSPSVTVSPTNTPTPGIETIGNVSPNAQPNFLESELFLPLLGGVSTLVLCCIFTFIYCIRKGKRSKRKNSVNKLEGASDDENRKSRRKVFLASAEERRRSSIISDERRGSLLSRYSSGRSVGDSVEVYIPKIGTDDFLVNLARVQQPELQVENELGYREESLRGIDDERQYFQEDDGYNSQQILNIINHNRELLGLDEEENTKHLI
eukprot:snap_masked-scaffold_6-processed-gene-6.19-mRNA-1 protein AED:1.00 eAED:1.00 QI:0/0/0/0/1/1/2/0/293